MGIWMLLGKERKGKMMSRRRRKRRRRRRSRRRNKMSFPGYWFQETHYIRRKMCALKSLLF